MPRRKSNPSSEGNAELIAAVERELIQIGDDLHDNLCQTLAGTSMIIETIGRAVAAREPISPQALTILRKILETAIVQARSLSQRFNPAKLGGGGLMSAFQRLAEETPNCEFHCEKPVFVDDPTVSLALWRIAYEAVKNSVRHSGARRIRITLRKSRGQIILAIKDNGCGFIVPLSNGKMTGLVMMERRSQAVGARLSAISHADRGTAITCRMPAKELPKSGAGTSKASAKLKSFSEKPR